MSAVFITGTDTGCGKTAVACALARAARRAGMRVRTIKPVETGCELRSGQLLPLDALALAHAAGDDSPLDLVCPYRLRLPAAPSVAARAEGVEIDVERLRRLCDAAQGASDLVIVEGAGGLLVPVNAPIDMAGLASVLQAPLIVVARAALGTINHTLLTLEAARCRDLAVIGVAISHTVPDLSAADRANLDELLRRVPARLLGELPHGADELEPPIDLAAWLASAPESRRT